MLMLQDKAGVKPLLMPSSFPSFIRPSVMPGNVELGHVADAAATVQKTAENPTANAPNLL